ncbi:hypothetical protein SAMN02745824_3150 [Parasphingorhabdus marina DSM 22363]|uniref:Uncharacterized protein n=2 Tax=Parasphingorhabdus marina TaxID=394732 RepID=A0A1N6H6B1_9SPHN|nr:hypothetical protein SAMN02745824_3150 [Parasphingorhabdus marina DSM 22363]
MVRKSVQKFPAALSTALFAVSCMIATPALARDDKEDDAPPAIFQAVIDCKDVSDPTARLACYDEKVAALESAQASKQVVVADREQIKKARRGLFGFSLPKIKLFGGGDDDKDEKEEFKELTTKIKSVRQNYRGLYIITIEEGDAVWEQTEKSRYSVRARSGDEIIIKRASLGSYKANIKGGRAIRVRRVR